MSRFPITPRIFAVFFPLAALLFSACAPTKKYCATEVRVDFAEALTLAHKSELAYLPDSVVYQACAADSCFLLTGGSTAARAFLQRNDSAKIQWLSFRGTQTLTDIQLDARYSQHRDPELGIFIHQGFADASDDLLPLVLPHLRKDYRTILTGHSLGGAVAVVAALHLEARGFTVETYTFGQPKVTNLEGARKYAGAHLVRFVNGRDLVPLMPPLDWKPGGGRIGSFAHFGREVLLDDGAYECLTSHYARNVDPLEWQQQAQAQAALDHLLVNYLGRLTKLTGDPVKPGPSDSVIQVPAE